MSARSKKGGHNLSRPFRMCGWGTQHRHVRIILEGPGAEHGSKGGGGRKIQIYLIHKVKFSKIGPIENKIIPRILSPPWKNSESTYGACMTTIIFPGI